MKNKISALVLCLLTICMLLGSVVPVSAESRANTVGEAQSLIDGIVDFKLNQSGGSSTQGWINGQLTNNAGTSSEWYVFALSQSGTYQFTAYQTALKQYLANHTVYSATSRQKYALCLIATGSTDTYISDVLENSIGQQGVMSWVYGLHLLNNGYISSGATTSGVKQKIVSLQLADGGWAVTGKTSDVDVTAMTIQALAPHYHSDSSVKTAVDKALALLSARQLATGDYSSYGVPNPESTAQVITALSALGIDGEQDNRFIKNGNTLFDGLQKYCLSDGSFCHKEGENFNDATTAQVFYSLVAYIRMANGKPGLYLLDNRNPAGLPEVKPPSSSGTTETEEAGGEQTPSSGGTSQVTGSTNGTETNTGAHHTDIQNKDMQDVGTQNAQDQESNVQNSNIPDTDENGDDTQVGNEQSAEIQNTNEYKDKMESKKNNYKWWVSLIIVVVAGITSLVLYLLKKRNKKNFIAIAIVTVLAIAFVGLTNFQSTDDYYSGKNANKENVVGTVTLTIRCDTIVGKSDSEYIPSDGIILDTTEFAIEENDSVYDILTEAAQKYNIQLENTGAEGMVYIAGINYLYEFAFGDLSGWMYYVNGEEPSVGCDEYILSNGDTIEWLYTCELGKDLK